jgi:glycosyltransferase 2 family protein
MEPTPNEITPTLLSRPLMRVIRTLVPLMLLGAILWTTNWMDIVDHTRGANPYLLAAAFAIYQVAVLVQGWRWYVLVSSDGSNWPLGRMQLVNYSSMFFDSFTPGKLGSDAYRVASLRERGRTPYLIISLLALRLHGMAASFVMAAVVGTIVLSIKHGWLKVAVPSAFAAIVVTIVITKSYAIARKGTVHLKYNGTGFLKSLAAQLSRAHDAVKEIFSNKKTLHNSNMLALVYTLLLVSTYWLTGLAFGMTLPYQNYMAVVPLLVLASVMPITIQGRGLIEVIAISCWQGLRASQEQVVLTCITVFAIMIIQGLLGGIVWVLTRGMPHGAERVD